MYKYDIVLKDGFLVDYLTGFEGQTDIAIKNGKIAKIAKNINVDLAQDFFELDGATVFPGVVDMHIHASAWLGGKFAHKMLAKAGVTTALDMSGPVDSVLSVAKEHGVGLNLATIEFVRPGWTVESDNPTDKELEELIKSVIKKGSIGIKLLGGHYPLTPEATKRAIAIAAKQKVYVAFHAGSKNTGSNLEGFLEAVQLADGHPLHLAHINAYCRGLIKSNVEEALIALNTLIENPNITSESYMSPLNGTSALMVDGVPASMVTRRCLITGGYEANESGFEQAVMDGWGQINAEQGGEVILLTGKKGVDYWKKLGDVGVSFAVNPAEPRYCLATAKRADGEFVVDAISTDGGGIPRNVILPMGLSLVEMQALTMKELVKKVCYNPAQVLGLVNKGHIQAGSDADITVVDIANKKAQMTIVAGQVVMYKDHVCGKGTNIITTKDGAKHVAECGLTPVITDLTKSTFYTRAQKKKAKKGK